MNNKWLWAESQNRIEERLERFCEKYKVNPTPRAVLVCAHRYINDCGGEPKVLLKYFIYKDEKTPTMINYKSLLLDYLDNYNDEELTLDELNY